MKTPNLIEVPATKRLTKLEALKSTSGIATFHSSHLAREDHPWIACHMPSAREISKSHGDTDFDLISLPEMFARYCRLLDENGIEATGETETDAVFNLCVKQNIPCVL